MCVCLGTASSIMSTFLLQSTACGVEIGSEENMPGISWICSKRDSNKVSHHLETRSVTIAWPHSQSLAAKMSGLNLQPSLGHQGCNVSGRPHPGWGGSRLVTKKCEKKLLCPFVKLGCYCCPRVPLQIRASFLLKDYGRWSWQMQQAWKLIQI